MEDQDSMERAVAQVQQLLLDFPKMKLGVLRENIRLAHGVLGSIGSEAFGQAILEDGGLALKSVLNQLQAAETRCKRLKQVQRAASAPTSPRGVSPLSSPWRQRQKHSAWKQYQQMQRERESRELEVARLQKELEKAQKVKVLSQIPDTPESRAVLDVRDHLDEKNLSSALAHISSMPTLSNLRFSEKQFTANSIARLIDALRGNCDSLRSLNLFGNEVMPDGAQSIAQWLPATNLIRLNLSYGKIGDAGIFHLTNIPMRLRYLCLAGNRITELGARALADNLGNLKRLDLDNNSIGDTGCKYLAVALSRNTKLHHLHLCRNKITDKGALVLTQGLESNFTLSSLSLKDNKIGDEGAYTLAEEAKLKKLELDGTCISAECKALISSLFIFKSD